MSFWNSAIGAMTGFTIGGPIGALVGGVIGAKLGKNKRKFSFSSNQAIFFSYLPFSEAHVSSGDLFCVSQNDG